MGFLDHRDTHDHREGEHPDKFSAEPPRRVYARVDRCDTRDDGGSRILYDSIDADWFDEVGERIRWLGDAEIGPEVGEQISVVEEERAPGELAKDFEGTWAELVFDRGGPEVQHYLNLFGAPLIRTLSDIRVVDSGTEHALTAKTGLQHLGDADPAEIECALAAEAFPDAAAVYDVGQGSSNALLLGGIPLVYFDLGGGALRDTRTFPQAFTSFCDTGTPPIVLSHWDWDHWSSARRDPRLIDHTWIVPRHDDEIGAVHTKFLGELHAQRSVLVWPRDLPSIRVKGMTVSQCTGKPRNHNDSGLALIAEANPGQEGTRMLFPGDASYRFVPGAEKKFTSVVAPHHGGRTRGGQIPASDGSKPGRLVFSYGAGNSFWHPLADVGREHAATWKKRLHTAARDARGLGHVHLYWNESDPAATPPCGEFGCSLSCHQR